MIRNLSIDYKKELEAASKGMILIHDPQTLIKLIIRIIVRKVGIQYGGVLLRNPDKDSYVLTISKGDVGIKVPAGFARFGKDNPIIKFFTEEKYEALAIKRDAVLVEDLNKLLWQESVIAGKNGTKEFLNRVSEQLQLFNAVACIPAYYHKDLLAVLLLGAKKDETKFDQNEIDFFIALASDVAMAIRNAQLFLDLKKEAARNKKLFLQVTSVLASTIEAKDTCTHAHTSRMPEHCVAIARQMMANGSQDFDDKFFEDLRLAALLHDIGKIGIPESILNKPGKLTDEEFEVMKRHTVIGEEILRPIDEFQECRKGVKYHHERYDGNGYPAGLKGDEIPLVAAIITVADTFDAMVSDRPYRKALSKEAAIEEIKNCTGTQFHPLVSKALIELYEAGEI